MRKTTTLATTLLLCLAAALPLQANRRRAVAPPEAALTIAFVDAPSDGSHLTAAGADAWLDLDTVRKLPTSRERNIRIRRRIGVRIDRAGAVAWGTAIVSARLESWDGRAAIRIDGRPLTTAPLIVNRRAAVGALTFHTIDIEVPESAAEGPLAASIRWEVTSE